MIGNFQSLLNFKASYNQTFTYIKEIYSHHMPHAKNSTKDKSGKISILKKLYSPCNSSIYSLKWTSNLKQNGLPSAI